MKKTITFLALLLSLVTFSSCKDKKSEINKNEIPVSNVPASVQTAFKDKYITATEAIWEDAHENDIQTYKVKFMLDDKKMKAEFDANGVLIKQKADK